MTRLPVATDAPMTDPRPTEAADDLFDQACGWYFRLQADDVTPADTAAFAAWHAQGVAQHVVTRPWPAAATTVPVCRAVSITPR